MCINISCLYMDNPQLNRYNVLMHIFTTNYIDDGDEILRSYINDGLSHAKEEIDETFAQEEEHIKLSDITKIDLILDDVEKNLKIFVGDAKVDSYVNGRQFVENKMYYIPSYGTLIKYIRPESTGHLFERIFAKTACTIVSHNLTYYANQNIPPQEIIISGNDLLQINEPETLTETLTDYFIWVSHGAQLGNTKMISMDCNGKDFQTVNFFQNQDTMLHECAPNFGLCTPATHNLEELLAIRPPLSITSCIDNENPQFHGTKQIWLPPIMMWWSKPTDSSFIKNAFGLWRYTKTPDNEWHFVNLTHNENPFQSEFITYSQVFKIISDVSKTIKGPKKVGVGMFICREVTSTFYAEAGPDFQKGSLNEKYQEPPKFTEYNGGFIVPYLLDITDEILTRMQTWTALLKTKFQGCGINVLSVLGIIPQHTGREIVSCLTLKGTSIFKMADYLAQNTSNTFMIQRFNIDEMTIMIDTINAYTRNSFVTNKGMVIKLYHQTKEGYKGETEFGHFVIVLFLQHGVYISDPQRSAIIDYTGISAYMSNYIGGDIIFTNSIFQTGWASPYEYRFRKRPPIAYGVKSKKRRNKTKAKTKAKAKTKKGRK
jgi:hypothetical protein